MPSEDRRHEERIAAALPLSFENGRGHTEDVAATGIFFWTDGTIALAVGDRINFTLEIVSSGRQIRPNCQGEIVRVETKGTQTGVAVRIVESAMELAYS